MESTHDTEVNKTWPNLYLNFAGSRPAAFCMDHHTTKFKRLTYPNDKDGSLSFLGCPSPLSLKSANIQLYTYSINNSWWVQWEPPGWGSYQPQLCKSYSWSSVMHKQMPQLGTMWAKVASGRYNLFISWQQFEVVMWHFHYGWLCSCLFLTK